jgi:hypothetical protein
MPQATRRTVTRGQPHRRHWISAAAGVSIGILLTACGHLWQTSTTPVPAAARDVSACAIAQSTSMGYKVVVDSVHRAQRDVEATKVLPRSNAGANPNEYSRRDVMSIIVSRAGDGNSSMRVTAGTISIDENRRGPTDINEPADANVIADADSLVARCRVANPPVSKS